VSLRYTSGDARTLVRGGAVVLLPAPVEPALVEQVWAQLGDDPGVVEVLQVLTGAFGSSLRTIPPFAVAVVTGRRVHVAVRGALAVTLEVEDGSRVHADGDDVTTWSERVVDDVVEVLVRTGAAPVSVPDGGPLLGAAAAWPLASGVVLADAVAWQLAERPARAEELPAVAPVPDAPEAPAPVPAPSATVPPPAPPRDAVPLVPVLRLPEETIAPEPDAFAPASAETVAEVPEGASDDARDAAHDDAASAAADAVPAPADDPEPEVDDYAHLWGSTILRTVEDAAVRAQDEDEDDAPPAPAADAAVAPVPPPPPGPAVPLPDEAPAQDGLIAGVPREWTGATPAAAHRAATVGPDDEPPAPGLDHDGHTVLSSAIADLRAAAEGDEPASSDAPPAPPAPPTPSFTAPPAPGAQQILARTCDQGHANPPSRDTCAVCGGPLDGDAALAVRPSLGRVLVSTGQTVELDRGVVVGRRPRSPRAQAADLPRLVTVPSPQQDISRSHVEIVLEGWHVLVSDMATTNGTTLLRAGQPPRRLHPSEPVLVVDGDVADLGDGVTLRFEGIW